MTGAYISIIGDEKSYYVEDWYEYTRLCNSGANSRVLCANGTTMELTPELLKGLQIKSLIEFCGKSKEEAESEINNSPRQSPEEKQKELEQFVANGGIVIKREDLPDFIKSRS